MSFIIINILCTYTLIKDSNIFTVLGWIKDEKYKKVIAKTRLLNVKKDRQEFKLKNLPAATFCGSFTYKDKGNLKKSSGLAMLDYDDIDNLEELTEKINKEQYTFSSFISPSGNGLKVLVKIPPVDNDEQYKEYYHELQKYFDKYAETDKSTTDISRGTYLSSDPNLFINAST